MPKPLVSIIVRTRDRPHLLSQALQSLGAQDYSPLEILVINDGGVDVATEVEPFREFFQSLILHQSSQSAGRAIAANQGLTLASGDFLGFLDDDDRLEPRHITELVAAATLAEQTAQVVYSGTRVVQLDAQGTEHDLSEYRLHFARERLYFGNFIPIHSALLARRLVSTGCSFDPAFELFEDWDFWLQLSQHTEFHLVDHLTAVYRIAVDAGPLHSADNRLAAYQRIYEKWLAHWPIPQIYRLLALAHQYQNEAIDQLQLRNSAQLQEIGTMHSHALAVIDERDQQIQWLDSELQRIGHLHSHALQVIADKDHQSERLDGLYAQSLRRIKELDELTARLSASIVERDALIRRLHARPARFFLAHSDRKQKPVMTIPVDIIIPVYRGLAETRACLESLIQWPQRTPFELIVIDDQSPEPELRTYLESLAAHQRITLLTNAENLGFVATVNHGMSLHPERDVVLLNSDTTVANDWLDRLRRCAYSDDWVATVTPFSNNATICSYPHFCQDNPLPPSLDVAHLDRCFATANAGASVEIPTAVGFCMLIRRAALQEVGSFDVEAFGKGYGEENDFCMRAIQAGWHHRLCADTFVYHAGNVSFGDAHNARKQHALEVLRRRHPTYESRVFAHIDADPARPYRHRATLARLQLIDRPLLLFITHNRQGGTQRHIQELIHQLEHQAQVVVLSTATDGSGAVELRFERHFVLYFQLDQDLEELVMLLSGWGISRIHVHHTLGLPPSVLGLAERLGVPWDFTVHDYYSLCPQITLIQIDGRYCGEPEPDGCNQCLKLRPAPGQVDIQTWRANHERLLIKASRCFAPSLDAAQRIHRYFPKANLLAVYHESKRSGGSIPQPPAFLEPRESLRVLVLGALSAMKGADLLEDAASDAKARRLPLDFTLIGYAYRNLAQAPEIPLQILGEYSDDRLAELIQEHDPHLIWFPALWPETYSYTLSMALRLGVPIVAPLLGAFPERLAGRPLSWLVPWDWSAEAFNDFFLQLKSGPFQGRAYSGIHAAGDFVSQGKISNFEYRFDYLGRLPARGHEPAMAQELLQALMLRHLAPNQNLASGIRSRALRILARLRASPWLSPLVKRIPAAWQTRVKDYLLGSRS